MTMKIAALAAGALAASYATQPQRIDERPVPTGNAAIREAGWPLHLSVEPGSPHYNPEVAKLLGVEFEGAKRKGDVREYCIEDPETGHGWVRIEAKLANGKPRIERGRYVTVTKRGIIKPYWR